MSDFLGSWSGGCSYSRNVEDELAAGEGVTSTRALGTAVIAG